MCAERRRPGSHYGEEVTCGFRLRRGFGGGVRLPPELFVASAFRRKDKCAGRSIRHGREIRGLTYSFQCAAQNAPARARRIALPLRRVENRLLRCVPDDAASVGVCQPPVSRLFSRRVGRYADSVLIASADGNTSGADLGLSRVTRLRGRTIRCARAGARGPSWSVRVLPHSLWLPLIAAHEVLSTAPAHRRN